MLLGGGDEFCHDSLGWDFQQALAAVGVVVVWSGIYMYVVGHHVRPGLGRLLAAVPVVALNWLLPKLFCRWQDTTTIVLMSFNIMWLSTFKAISWALNRGALCIGDYTAPQFVAIYTFPITPQMDGGPGPAGDGSASYGDNIPHAHADAEETDLGKAAAAAAAGTLAGGRRPGGKGRLGESAGSWRWMVAVWLLKFAFMSAMLWLLQYPLPGFVEAFIYGMSLYALLSLIMDGPAGMIIGMTGLHVSPHFDKPFLSTSLSSFWSKRWDLAAGNTLRQLIYDPIVERRLLVPPAAYVQAAHRRPSPKLQLLGSFASFLASGLVHECIFWHLTGHTTRGVWLSFFLVHVPLVALERVVLAALKRRRIILPDWLRVIYTMTVVTLTTQYLFFAPCTKHGVTQSIIDNCRSGIKRTLRQLSGTG